MNSLMLLQFHELSTTQTDSADTKRDDKKKTLIPENSGTKLTVISNWKFLQESTRN